MPTRGRFVCHVHCLVHDGAVRSSPCRPHHENFGRNLYHMFVPAYSASQSFVFVLSCGIRVASMSSVDSIPFRNGVLILRCEYQSFSTIEIVMSILFNRCVSLQVDPITSTFARSIISSSQRCLFHPSPSCLCFSLPPTLFPQGLRFLYQVSFYFCEVSPFFSVNVLTRWFRRRCSTSSSFPIPFSSPVDSSQVLLIIPFSSFQ